MRTVLSVACMWPLIAGGAIGIPLEELGRQFSPPANVVIEWKATNVLPAQVTVYGVVGREFSSVVMSNMLALGAWKIDQRTRVPGRKRVPQDKDIVHFGREDEPKQLSVYPPAGLIQYRDSQACASPSGRAHAVPDETEALHLARAFLKRLEIDERDLVKDTNGQPRVVRAKTTHGRQGIQEVISRSISFTRESDGIPFTGYNFGGVGIAFGNEGKIASLEVVWPNLKATERLATVSPPELMSYVEHGRSASRWGAGSDELMRGISKLQRITVNEVKFYYLGNSLDDMRTTIFPFATLEITAHLPNTNYVVWLNAPMAASVTK